MSLQHELDLSVIPIDPDPISFSVSAIKLRQPIGDIIVANFPYKDLIRVSFFDVRRRIQELRDVERYLGIQRPLIPARVTDLEKFVNFADAAFPTTIIVAVEEDYAEFDEASGKLTLRNYTRDEPQTPSTNMRRLARVIDGQHRIAGLMAFNPISDDATFDVAVTVFIGSDIADQAYIFSTVNLEQTKVSRSLAFDLFELARTRSPQKTCHNIAVALDREKEGPLEGRIKRLGFAEYDREFAPLTQATVVDEILEYITPDPKTDRDTLLRGKRLQKYEGQQLERYPFRNMFVDERDVDIARCISSYFIAVRERWPQAWNDQSRGMMLNRTNGFKALMKAMKHFYLRISAPGHVPTAEQFLGELRKVSILDRDFTIDEFVPGTGGQARLVRVLTGRENFEPTAI